MKQHTTRWLFETGNIERSVANVLRWWAQRYMFWLGFVTLLLGCGAATACALYVISGVQGQTLLLKNAPSQVLDAVPSMLAFLLLAMVVANTLFWLVAFGDSLSTRLTNFLAAWRLSVGFLMALLALAICATLIAIFAGVVILQL